MKVSVITPTLNREKYIEKTIQSVLSQTYKNIEYIVVDGQSDDKTLEILEKYRKLGSLQYISEPDDGMYCAINKGFKIATGDVLAYLNADDYYFPWTVDTIVKSLQENSEVDVLYGDTMVIDLDTNCYHFNFTLDYSTTWLKCGANLAQPAVFVRRDVYERLGDLAAEVIYLGDCEYWLRAINENFKFLRIPEFLAIESNHEQTLRNRFETEIEEERLFLLKRYRSKLGSSSVIRKMYKRLKYLQKEVITLRFMRYCQNHNHGEFWNNFISSYNVKFSVASYLINKIFRFKKPIWTVSPKKLQPYDVIT